MCKIIKTEFIFRILIYLCFFTFLGSYNIAYCTNYDEHVVIVKFKPNSSLFKIIRKAVPASVSNSLQYGNIPDSNPKLIKFFNDYGIYSIKAAKPDADDTPLPGGVERIFILRLNDTISNAVIGLLANTQDIEYAEHDFIEFEVEKNHNSESILFDKCSLDPNDPLFNGQWGLRNIGQFGGVPGADINILPAWDISTGSAKTLVAVLDSGIPNNNPEFVDRIIQGYDFIHNTTDPRDDEGHGTHVTGIIAATGDNGILISGVNWGCKILPLKIVGTDGISHTSMGITATIYATDHGARVINYSIGQNSFSQAFQDAVQYAYNNNVIFIASVGNNNNNAIVYPAGFSNVIAVGAITDRNKRAEFSNYGRWLDFVAPGERILSLSYSSSNNIDLVSGTSVAAPFVTGLVSLMIGLRNDLTFQDIYGLLRKGAKDQIGDPNEDTPGWDQFYGWGCIDAGKTMQYLMDTVIVHPVPDNYYLNQNYPNPFNFNTTIEYGIPNDGYVNLSVYNTLGQNVTTLVNQFKKAGKYIVYWDGFDYSSDIYFYLLRFGDKLLSKKMVFVK